MTFHVERETFELMNQHIEEKTLRHLDFNRKNYVPPYMVRIFSIAQIRYKLDDLENGSSKDPEDDAKDIVHYALFILQSYIDKKEEE